MPAFSYRRLATDSALRRYLTDQEAVSCHESSLNPVPWGKVKRIRQPWLRESREGLEALAG